MGLLFDVLSGRRLVCVRYRYDENTERRIKTVETKFDLAVPLKGKLDASTFRLLHLSRKDGEMGGMFGAVGTFFIDFHAEHNKQMSFLFFM